MTGISTRLERRVWADFPHHANLVTAALIELTSDIFPSETRDSPAIERIQVAALLAAGGDLGRLDDALVLGKRDWRDLLVLTGLAGGDWQSRVAAVLDPALADRRAIPRDHNRHDAHHGGHGSG